MKTKRLERAREERDLIKGIVSQYSEICTEFNWNVHISVFLNSKTKRQLWGGDNF